ncbi:MAG: class I SAM-dependent methyltransferase [Flavobacteriaceae bacterium]|nr:class I SAM-dependent methyltransferase [Flavobacteriaceae bacterium]
MFSKIVSYLKFLLKSKNHHGVHSPFVYHLVTECFYKKQHTKDLTVFYQIRKNLFSDTSNIEIEDFGAGSKVFKSNTRQVSKIAKYAGISKKRAALLYNVIRYFQPKSIIEIGTSLGLGSSVLSLAAPNSRITSIEGCKRTGEIAETLFKNYSLQNIKLTIGNFKTVLPKLFQNNSYDFIYFDGNHTKKATLDYFNAALPSIHNDSVFLFDDIHWSKGMEDAWAEIKNNPIVTVTIDTFQWGFVFFRKEQQKEHFTIRI